MLIIGILSATAMPKLGDALMFYRAKSAALRIKADLRYARETARTGNANETVSFNLANSQYSLSSAKNLSRSGAAYSVDLDRDPYQSVLTLADFNGSTDVTFNAFGIPDNGGQVIVETFGYAFIVDLNAETGKATVTLE